MFKNLILKALKSLSPEEKSEFRESLKEEKVEEPILEEKVGEEKQENELKGEEKEMENEKIEEKVENNEVEEKKEGENVETEESKVEEQVATDEEKENENPQVQEVEPQGNGVRVEDLVTKEELMEKLAAFEAKFAAVVKENEDLKNKYENKDFGNIQKQGVLDRDKKANDTFDEYSKQFM